MNKATDARKSPSPQERDCLSTRYEGKQTVAATPGETDNALQQVQNDITALIHTWEPRLSAIDRDILNSRRNGQNRTIKQIIGHLIDSASNNLHRTVHLQYRQSPLQFPDYANLGMNDRWIAVQNYQAEEWTLLVQHWKFSNLHLAHVIGQIDRAALGNIWVSALGENISLFDMVVDYPRHFTLHLREIAELLQ